MIKMGKLNLESPFENNEEVESDSDICDEENINKLFIKCECTSEVVVSSDFILHVDSTRESNPNIVVATADKFVKLYNAQNSQVAKIGEYSDYNDKLIGCRFSSRDTNLLYTGSSDGCIKLLDLRTKQIPAVQFTDTTAENKFKTFNCFDVSSNDRLLSAGTDVIDGDAFIVFWDIRKHNVLGGYWEGHTDDITQVKFHPEDMNKLISGSTDGLINLFDLTQATEDDALLDTLNTESSIDQLSWFIKNNKSCISCITHTSDLQLWDLDNGEPYQTLTRLDISNKMMKKHEDFVYLANSLETKNGLLVLAGSNFGDGETLRGLITNKNTIDPYFQLSTNKQRIRDSSCNENIDILITVGEKGFLNIWKLPQPF